MRIMSFMRMNTQGRQGQLGTAVIEFALVLIILLMIVAAVIEFGRIFWYYTALTKATRDGARQMALLQSFADIGDVQTIVVGEANAARVSQDGASTELTAGNVSMECLSDSFTTVGCSDDTPPAYVRVGIVGFNVKIGGWIPLLTPDLDPDSYGVVTLSPQTIMSYMR